MNVIIKATAVVLVTLVVYLLLLKQGKDFSLLLSVAVCAMVAVAALQYLEPIFDFFDSLQLSGSLDEDALELVLKTVGIGLLVEVSALICTDCGNAAMGKVLQILGSIVILSLSLPLFTSLMELVEEILVNI